MDDVSEKQQIPVWPLVVLAAPAAVAIWSGWVGLGGLTGFGNVKLLPGIWDDLQINTAITLPIGMEAYAAYALRVWLADGERYWVPDRAREFAKWSSIGALILGVLGQITFHLLSSAGVSSADGVVTALVSALPVGVLGMGASLAHLLRDGAVSVSEPVQETEPAVDFPAPIASAPAPTWVPFQSVVEGSLAARVRPAVSAPEPVSVPQSPRDEQPEMKLNGSVSGRSEQASDIGRKPSVVSEDSISTRDYILSMWRQGVRVESADLYERFPERKRESLRSVLSTVRRGKDASLEPPARTTEE